MNLPARRPLVLGLLGVLLAALLGGGLSYLLTSSSTPTTPLASAGSAADPGADPAAGPRPGRAGHGAKGARGGQGGGMLGQAEHGEFTTANAAVMQVQRGAITAVDPGSVTVRSTDGFTASYVITPTTRVGPGRKGAAASGAAPTGAAPTADVSALKAGDTVRILATKTDTGSTATRITPARG